MTDPDIICHLSIAKHWLATSSSLDANCSLSCHRFHVNLCTSLWLCELMWACASTCALLCEPVRFCVSLCTSLCFWVFWYHRSWSRAIANVWEPSAIQGSLKGKYRSRHAICAISSVSLRSSRDWKWYVISGISNLITTGQILHYLMVGYRKSDCFKISWNCWGMTPKLWNLGWMGFWDGTGVCQETYGLPTSHYAHSLMDASSPSQGAVCSSMRCKALLSTLTCGDLVLLCILVCKVMLCHAIQDYVQLSTICAM